MLKNKKMFKNDFRQLNARSLNSSFEMFVELINIIKRLDFFQSFAFNIVNLFYSASTKARFARGVRSSKLFNINCF